MEKILHGFMKPNKKIGGYEDWGFSKKAAGRGYVFNENDFADELRKTIYVVYAADANYYIYDNKAGKYRLFDERISGNLTHEIMNSISDEQLWTLKRERAAVESFKRSVRVIDQFMNSGNVLNLANGVFDLDRFELLPHSEDYLTTMQLPYAYNQKSIPKKFLEFIDETTVHNEALKAVIQEMIGYCLCNGTKAEKAFLWLGSGRNGKSVLANILHRLLGAENVSGVSLNTFNNQFGFAGMIGKKANISPENELRGTVCTEAIKTIASGDPMNIAVKYQSDYHGALNLKLIFLMNSLPTTRDYTNGFFRKLIIIPFQYIVPEDKVDRELTVKLTSELPGILNWAIEGLKRLSANNFKFSDCEAVSNALMSYRDAQNPVERFWRELVVKNDGSKTKKAEFFKAYSAWCSLNGEKSSSPEKFWKNTKTIVESQRLDLYFDIRSIHGVDFLYGYSIRSIDSGVI